VSSDRLATPDGKRQELLSSDLFRAVNERIRELAGEWLGDYDFMCECEDERCTRVLRMSAEQYEAVRSDPGTFVVLSGHESPQDEVVDGRDGLVVVRRPRPVAEALPAAAQPSESAGN
jgi:hypothetical protein